MSDTIIQVQNIGKKYIIRHHTKERYTALRDVIAKKVLSAGRRIFDPSGSRWHSNRLQEEFWALKNVSFEVKEGEVVGIIGRNGAGKSTLLKILSRITEPNTGRAHIKGRVASLLEVGTGFHSELTGRENIFLNGGLLGMRKGEIVSKFNEIVEFAEIDKFLDTPVKRYSSGMYVRLAFAVAAHLEPEILLVDEVLAVGDAAFQKKCLGKMSNVAKGGRTVLFVSHNMSAVRRLCERALYLSSGELKMDGPIETVINEYLYEKDYANEFYSSKNFGNERVLGNDDIKIKKIELISEKGSDQSSFSINEAFEIIITYEIFRIQSNFHYYARIYTEDGTLAFCSADWDGGEVVNTEKKCGVYQTSLHIPGHFLNHGKYYLHLLGIIPSVRILFQESDVIGWEIIAKGGTGGIESINRPGIFRPLLKWQTRIE